MRNSMDTFVKDQQEKDGDKGDGYYHPEDVEQGDGLQHEKDDEQKLRVSRHFLSWYVIDK